jgi:integrase
MKRKYPPFVHGYVDQHDTAKFYFRRAGKPKIRLPGLPWSAEFMAAYEQAKSGQWSKREVGASRTVPGTVNAALVIYYQSSAFRDGLAESSQKMRRAILECFREEHGEKRIGLLHKKALQAILDKKSPAAASNWRKALRGFIDHAMSLDMLTVDPLAGIKLVSVKSDGHHSWEAEECSKFEAHHVLGTRARLAYELLLQIGQSRCDVVRLGRQHVRNGTLSQRRQKTKQPFDVPVIPALQEAIDAMPASDHLTFLVTAQGKPFTAAGFGNWFREICDNAGLPKRCTSHGLRKAAATRLADRGGTTTELKAWFGWKTDSEAERYTRNADRKSAAARAGKKIMSGTEIGSPQYPVSQNSNQPIEKKEVR